MPKTTKEILTEARSLITDRDNWTQGFFARDSEGLKIGARDTDAVCWCAWGALGRSANEDEYATAWQQLTLFMEGSIARFNDSHTHEEVLTAFDKAIESCKEE